MACLESCLTLAYSEPCHVQDPGIFRNKEYIQNSVKTYSGIFITFRNARILKTLPYLELWHIYNFGILMAKAYLESCLFRHIHAYSGIFNNGYPDNYP